MDFTSLTPAQEHVIDACAEDYRCWSAVFQVANGEGTAYERSMRLAEYAREELAADLDPREAHAIVRDLEQTRESALGGFLARCAAERDIWQALYDISTQDASHQERVRALKALAARVGHSLTQDQVDWFFVTVQDAPVGDRFLPRVMT